MLKHTGAKCFRPKVWKRESGVNVIKSVLETLLLSGLGTAALVGAHHFGRKQYNADARLTDYFRGAFEAYQNKFKKPMQHPNWISGIADLKSHEFAVVGIDAEREIIWHTPMPERVHDILVQPTIKIQNSEKGSNKSCSHAVVMGRRPSEYFWVLSARSGDILYEVKASLDRHFYGHACYSLDGKILYVTENNTQTFAGVIGVYDVSAGYKKINELSTRGIGPHELVMHPDGDTLVIANGGIKTEKASRDELNLDSMQPSLVYLNRYDGKLIQQVYPEHNQMSVRHLSMHEDGTVAVGIQFQGERHLTVPLVLIHKKGQPNLTPLTLAKNDTKGWHRFHHYIASVVIDSNHNLLCVTSPIGGCVAIFDLATGTMIADIDIPDCAGVATINNQSKQISQNKSGLVNVPSFIVSDGQGYLTRLTVTKNSNDDSGSINSQKLITDSLHLPFAFDNHMKQL